MLEFVLLWGIFAQDKPAAPVDQGAIPKDAAIYFEVCDTIYATQKKELEDRLKAIGVQLNGSTGIERARLLKDQRACEASLRNLKHSEIKPFLSPRNEVDNVGHLDGFKVDTIIDKRTMIVHSRKLKMMVVINDMPTSGLKKGVDLDREEMFRVTSLQASADKIVHAGYAAGTDIFRDGGLVTTRWEAQRIPRGDILKWRPQFEQSKGKAPQPGQPVVPQEPDKPAVPQAGLPENAVSKGSFSVWTEPQSPQAGASYDIVLQVRLPQETKSYRPSDLSGVIVGSDQYKQVIRHQAKEEIPVVDGVTHVRIRVPGAGALIEDKIHVESKILNEKQDLVIRFTK